MNRTAANCRDVVELVTEYLDGGLLPGERLAFERHVAICPPCRAHLGQMRRVLGAAGALRDGQVPERLRRKLVDDFRGWQGDPSR